MASDSIPDKPSAGTGFPHLAMIKDSIKLLFKSLSSERIHSFSRSVSHVDVRLAPDCELIIAVQKLAGVIVKHLQLPVGCILVNFQEMEQAGRVQLTPADDYLVDLNARYRNDRRDIAAVLAHELTHVFLHRQRIWLADTLQNEVLTDTTAAYLGVGWLSLNAHRVTESRRHLGDRIEISTRDERLGYLTPSEFGYVLARRGLLFGERAEKLLTSPAARSALKCGLRQAWSEKYSAPLSNCGWWRRCQYLWHRRYVRKVHRESGLSGTSRRFGVYQFEVGESEHVVFECPNCTQKLRVPVAQRLVVRCKVCDSKFDCTT